MADKLFPKICGLKIKKNVYILCLLGQNFWNSGLVCYFQVIKDLKAELTDICVHKSVNSSLKVLLWDIMPKMLASSIVLTRPSHVLLGYNGCWIPQKLRMLYVLFLFLTLHRWQLLGVIHSPFFLMTLTLSCQKPTRVFSPLQPAPRSLLPMRCMNILVSQSSFSVLQVS